MAVRKRGARGALRFGVTVALAPVAAVALLAWAVPTADVVGRLHDGVGQVWSIVQGAPPDESDRDAVGARLRRDPIASGRAQTDHAERPAEQVAVAVEFAQQDAAEAAGPPAQDEAVQHADGNADAPAADHPQQQVPACGSEERAGQIVDGMIQTWKAESPIARSLEQRGVLVIEGLAQIGLHTDHPDWGKARSLAYTRAYLDAMRVFVEQTSVGITTQTVHDDLEDATSIPFDGSEDATSYLNRIDRKAAVLAELRLDQALAEAGMSDEEIAQLSGAEKIPRVRDALARESTSRAFGRAAGLVPLKTFEAVCDGGSNSAVGVAAAFSTRMRALAEQVFDGQPIRPNPDRAGVPLRDRINALSDEDLVEQFGVRIWWDRDGYPVIIAFGQWGWSTKALTAAQQDRRYRFARDQAAAQAKSSLAEFIQINAQFTSSSFVGSTIEEAVEVDADGFHSYVSGTAITDRMIEEARTRSKVQLTGLGILRTWSSQHPVAEHQELTGAVAYWSPAREDQVRASLGLDAKHPAPEPAEPAPESEPEPPPAVSGTVQSKDLMDASDF